MSRQYRSYGNRRGGSYWERLLDRLRDWQQQIGTWGTVAVVVIAAVFIVALVRVIARGDIGSMLAILLGRGIGLLLGFSLHEWAHAYSAYRLGGYRALPDPNRLSLDPRRHIDPIGIVLALVAGFGWAKPVPVNPQAFHPNQRRDMLTVAFAGPLMNLVIAFVVAMFLRAAYLVGIIEALGRAQGSLYVIGSNNVFNFLYEIVATVVFFNILLFLFNLIPLFPLDGWRVLLGVVSSEQAYALRRQEQNSMIVLYLLIMLSFVNPNLNIIFAVLGPPLDAIYELMTGFVYFR